MHKVGHFLSHGWASSVQQADTFDEEPENTCKTNHIPSGQSFTVFLVGSLADGFGYNQTSLIWTYTPEPEHIHALSCWHALFGGKVKPNWTKIGQRKLPWNQLSACSRLADVSDWPMTSLWNCLSAQKSLPESGPGQKDGFILVWHCSYKAPCGSSDKDSCTIALRN